MKPALPPTASQVRAHFAGRDTQEPSLERRWLAQLVYRGEGVNENLLSDIFGIGFTSQQSIHQAHHARGVSVVEPPRRPADAALERFHQLGVGLGGRSNRKSTRLN